MAELSRQSYVVFPWGDDREFGAALYLLDTPLIADRVRRFVDAERREIRWTALHRATRGWSESERLLVEAAHALWNWNATEGKRATLGALYVTLERDNLERVIGALAIRRGLAVAYA
jgi:hypothetical protein